MSRITPGVVVGASVATLAAAGIGYALYFDYKRRNDPVFRKHLFREQRKLAKASAAQASREKVAQADALKNAIRQMKNEEPPRNVEEREAYFLEQVAMGEALAAKGPAFYVPAAISFFKGLQVYPQPQELLMIYSKTQPAEVVQLLMEALKYSITEDSGPSSRASRQAPRGGAILEEIDTDSAENESSAAPRNGSSASGYGSQAGESSASSPKAGSYVNVDFPSPASAAS